MDYFIRQTASACVLLALSACASLDSSTSLREGEPLTAEAALRIALSNNPSLQGQLAKLPEAAPQEVINLTADVRKAWFVAVASAQTARFMAEAKETVQTSTELAQRMTRSGAWSRVQQTQEQVNLLDFSAQLARAQQAALSDKEKLIRLMGLAGTPIKFTLPDRLPDLPQEAKTLQDLQKRALQQRLNIRNAVSVEARQAFFTYQTAYQLAKRYRDEVVPSRQLLNEQMVLRYKGLLASAGELLADTRERILSMNSATEALRDFWLADTDLQTVLTGTVVVISPVAGEETRKELP